MDQTKWRELNLRLMFLFLILFRYVFNRWSGKLTEKFFVKLINYFLNSSDFESFMTIDFEISLNFSYNGQLV